ncbi:glycosyltransferase family 4 protein [Cohnella herbarum]|uniref:Glycosyltransferase family 4 protein n=1 Tax=Cohnella herbarum TaxID=2728023 RepID=A0A7Z2ZPI0_9BACL|nr:glycosyltransferase family 4 protein [Cohnella herbarum]QJD87184.1 glycosyltransferase family 4 protein [Cohnella herbarum]
MDDILFYDLSNDGHHYNYNSLIMKHVKREGRPNRVCYYTESNNPKIVRALQEEGITVHNVDLPLRKGIMSIRARTVILLRMLRYARKNDYRKIHLLFMDSNIISLFLLLPLLIGLEITGTLHWYPTRKWKEKVFYWLLNMRVIDRIVVHGDFTRDRVVRCLANVGNRRVVTIYFPSFHHSDVKNSEAGEIKRIKQKLASYKRPFFLCFGGLRYDKGIDLLLEAVARLKDEDFTVLVAGSEDYFNKADIDRIALENGITNKVFLDLKYISTEAANFYFQTCDSVVLPYRSMYSAQSGPLVEGAARKKLIVGPGHGEVGFTIEKYRLGLTFESDRPDDLARKLQTALDRLNGKDEEPDGGPNEYASKLTQEKFGDLYRKFFANDRHDREEGIA